MTRTFKAGEVTTEQIQKLRELEKAASPGPWKSEYPWCSDENQWAGIGPIHTQPDDEDELDPDSEAGKQASADMELIAESRNALPALLNEIERIREREAKLKGALEFYASGIGSHEMDCSKVPTIKNVVIGTKAFDPSFSWRKELSDQPDFNLWPGNRARTTLAELYPEEKC